MDDRLLRLLGSPHLEVAGRRHDLPNNVPGFLVAWLAVRGDWAERDAIALVFWPDMAQAQSLHNLRANLHRLKAWLDGHGLGHALQAEKRRIRLDLPCDVTAFRSAIGGAQWEAALDWHRGELMASASLPGMPGVDEWLHAQRQALAAAWRDAALRQVERWQATGHAAEAAALLQRQLEHDLLAEDLLQALLRVAADAGCVAPALALHDRFVGRLRDELGQSPLPHTAVLAAALRGDVARPRHGDLSSAPASPSSPPASGRSLPARLAEPMLVGRERELDALQAACARPGLVVLRGEPGVGKSRLAAAVLPRALWWSCREPGAAPGAPLAPVTEYLADTLEALRDREPVRRHAGVLARLVPALQPDDAAAPAAPADDRLLPALVEVFCDLDRPIVVDDLQWADAQTLALLQALERSGRLTLLATLRHQALAPALQAWLDALAGPGRATTVSLGPLPEPALARLLAHLSGQPQGAPRFAAWLHARSAGNPLFALESLRALFAQGRLTEDAAGWHHVLDGLAAGYDELSLPARVAEVVRSRIEALGDATQRVLRVCAVAGDARWLEPLAQVSGLSAMGLGEALGEAQQASVLQGRRFAHELLRQAVLEGMPEALRAATHGAWLRQAHDRLEPHARAAHAWAAGDVGAAVKATLDAARRDARRGLHDAAAALLADTLQRLPADDEHRAGLHAARAQVCLQQARFGEADDEALRALSELPTPAQRALALSVRAGLALHQGRLADVPPLVDEALAADPNHSETWMIRVHWTHAQGDYPGGESMLRERLRRLRAERPGPELVEVLTSLGSFIDFQGRHREALPLHREALALARRLGSRYAEVQSAVNLLWCLPELGLHDEAMDVGEQALALGHYDATPTLANNLAYLYLTQGRAGDAARIYAGLADGPDPTLACVAQAKLLQIDAGRGDVTAVDRQARALLDRMAATEHAQAHAIAVLALLEHAPAAFREQALGWLPRVAVDTELQARLDAAVARARAA